MNKRTKKGFTLIELIVVIAVLALLAVVAVPKVSSWVDDAKDAEAAANARTIELAMKAYMAEKGVTAITSDTTIADALEEYGIDNPIDNSSANYKVAKDGSVTSVTPETGKGGDISFETPETP